MLNAGKSNIDTQQLSHIYKQATDKISSIQKSFDDLLIFHNRMIREKVKYITKDLPKLNKELESKNDFLT